VNQGQQQLLNVLVMLELPYNKYVHVIIELLIIRIVVVMLLYVLVELMLILCAKQVVTAIQELEVTQLVLMQQVVLVM
jgi:hypothetical protein